MCEECPWVPALPVRCFDAKEIQELKDQIRRALYNDNTQARTNACVSCHNNFRNRYYTVAGPQIYQRTQLCEYCYDALILQRPDEPCGRLTSKGTQLVRLLDTLDISEAHICLFPRQAALCRSILEGRYSFAQLYYAESEYGRAVSTGPALRVESI